MRIEPYRPDAAVGTLRRIAFFREMKLNNGVDAAPETIVAIPIRAARLREAVYAAFLIAIGIAGTNQ